MEDSNICDISGSLDKNEPDWNINKYKCSIENCNEYFRREKDLDKHEFSHNGIRKYDCSFANCTKMYILKSHLKRHTESFHFAKNKDKEFPCPIKGCKRTFAHKYNIERHIEEYHNKIREFKCPDCDRVYERKSNLKLHQITHTNKYPFICCICNAGFVSEAMLKRHNCQKHFCEECSQSFQRYLDLVKHCHEKHPKEKKKHTVSCPYEGCDKIYSDRRNLKTHINIKHLNKKFKCTVEGCGKELVTNSKLQQHIQKIHEKSEKSSESKISSADNTKTRKPRTRRKDAGIKRKSTVGILANIRFNTELDKNLINDPQNVVIEENSDVSIKPGAELESSMDGKINVCQITLEIAK